jgi:uncharacterized protein YdaU (DUF1376 family)
MTRRRGRARNGLFVFYCAKDFLDGTALLKPMEELAYRRICDLIYASNDEVEDDDEVLAVATKTGAEWPAIKQALVRKHKIIVEGGRVRNLRCVEELERAAEISEKRRDAANERWGKAQNSANVDANASPHAAPNAGAHAPPTQNPSPLEPSTSNQEPPPPLTPPPPAATPDPAAEMVVVVVDGFLQKREEVFGVVEHPPDHARLHTEARKLLAEEGRGLSPAAVVDVIAAEMRKLGAPPSSPRFCRLSLRNVANSPRDGPPAPRRSGAKPIEPNALAEPWEQRLQRIDFWREHMLREWGPLPGEPGCRVPASILEGWQKGAA